MNTKKVSATNVRVNLTEVISELDASNRVAITKHGKVIAYLVDHIEEEEVVTDPSPVEEPQPVIEDVEEELDMFLEEEEQEKKQLKTL